MNQNQHVLISQNDAKYRNARASLLMIVIFSALNVFSIAFGDMYFLFSAYVSQILVFVGLEMSFEAGDNTFLIISMVMAIVSIVPYLLCWIFSKKKFGWMIAALVFFSLDSIIFAFDFAALLLTGDYSFIIDLLFRIWAFVSIIMGVVYAVKAKKEDQMKQETPQMEEPLDDYVSEVSRTVTVIRKKSFVGCTVPVVCFIDGKAVCALKNGESQKFQLDERAAELAGALPNGYAIGSIKIPAGAKDLAYEMVMKMGFSSNYVVFTPVQK